MKSEYIHQPVMPQETLAALTLKEQGNYIDGTYGRGGHSQAILNFLSSQGFLLAIDKDLEAVTAAQQRFVGCENFSIVHASFSKLHDIVEQKGLVGKIDGILLDLGVSSPQLEDPNRGFSFLRDGPLDMRMDASSGMSAAEWLASATQAEIKAVLKNYGEERYAGRIATAIVHERELQPIETTKQLADIVSQSKPNKEFHKNPSTRVFQALRIFINNELNDLQLALEQSLQVLRKGGRLVVISFHSLEDRIVKQFMRKHSRAAMLPKELPIKDIRQAMSLCCVGKALKASQSEIKNNPRARSAVLRIAEKMI